MRTSSGERADEWTLERAAATADIDVDLLERVAELYAEAAPAVIRCGWGLERNRNGGNAAMAVLALPAVAGKFGVRGGGFSMSNSAAVDLAGKPWIGAAEPPTRVVNMNRLGRALTGDDGPPVKLLFVYNCNPGRRRCPTRTACCAGWRAMTCSPSFSTR